MKLFVICNESPFPPVHGGRVDQWSRFNLLHRSGCKLMLATWYMLDDGPPNSDDREILGRIFERSHLFPITKRLAALAYRLIWLPRYSPHVSTRILQANELARLILEARDFGPDAIWLDGLYGAVLARHLALALGVPLLYRSHNVEFRYIRSQAAQAVNWRDRIAWALASVHLESFETHIQRASQAVFDLSTDDLAFWRSRGIHHNFWAPPLFELGQDANGMGTDRSHDVVFLGNLHAPNNVRGIAWFLNQVLPSLVRARADLKVAIAGSRPSAQMRLLMARHPNVSFVENPPSSSAILREGRILINPILSGSGVNVKSIEMLFWNAHLVTTATGVRGLPGEVRREFHVADSPDAFAQAILCHVDRPYELTAGRVAARRLFGPDGIVPLLALIRAAVADAATSRIDQPAISSLTAIPEADRAHRW